MNSSLLTHSSSCFLMVEALQCFGYLACIGAHFPIVELNYPDWFSIVSDPFRCLVTHGISAV